MNEALPLRAWTRYADDSRVQSTGDGSAGGLRTRSPWLVASRQVLQDLRRVQKKRVRNARRYHSVLRKVAALTQIE